MERALKIIHEGRWWEFVTRMESGYDVTVTDEIVLREIFLENVYQVVAGDLDDTGVVVDVGGNIGAFGVYCAALGAKAVHTYEPDSLNYAVLEHNVAVNGLQAVVYPHKLAVGAQAGTGELVQGQGASFVRGVKRLTPEARRQVQRAESEPIELVPLAAVFADNGVPYCDILKIDCEGSEYQIIGGAPTKILRKARYITMEFHPADEETFGRMVARLSLTHNLHIIGRHTVGGQIYGRRY